MNSSEAAFKVNISSWHVLHTSCSGFWWQDGSWNHETEAGTQALCWWWSKEQWRRSAEGSRSSLGRMLERRRLQRVLKNTEGQPPRLCHKRSSLCGALRKVQTGLEGLDLLLHPSPGILHPSFILIDSQCSRRILPHWQCWERWAVDFKAWLPRNTQFWILKHTQTHSRFQWCFNMNSTSSSIV